MRVMKKDGSQVVHRMLTANWTHCNQSGWRNGWDYWENKTDGRGVPVMRCTLRACLKCFPRARCEAGKDRR